MKKPSFSILMVDDDEDDCMLVGEAIEELELKHKFLCLSCGLELMEYLNRQERNKDLLPNLILLDLNMPRMSGREVLKIIKSNADFKKIPVIVLTTSNEDSDVLSSYDAGANSYIIKPNDFKTLTMLVQSLHDYWVKIVSLPE